ncbi:MAG: plasmid stabilization protein [Gemmatimonadetes bacterium]|nr:plasmid stabilization protein [Gemmatimonadota bacterium]
MPRGFTKKDERQYEHIKEGYEHRGVSEKRAEEIAARTVNKERHEEGRTREQRGSQARSGGSRDAPTRDELYQQARKLGIEGRSKMDKEELRRAVQRGGK